MIKKLNSAHCEDYTIGQRHALCYFCEFKKVQSSDALVAEETGHAVHTMRKSLPESHTHSHPRLCLGVMTTDAHPPKLNYAQKTSRAMNREVQILCAAVRSPPQFVAKWKSRISPKNI